METLEAIAKAKDHITMMFQEENITNIGLEEVEYMQQKKHWHVTIGFSRPWDHPLGIAAAVGGRLGRTYKEVVVDDKDGRVLAVKHRALASVD